MEITEIRKKVKKCVTLLSDYENVSALLRHMDKEPTTLDGKYYANVMKRRTTILIDLNNLLK